MHYFNYVRSLDPLLSVKVHAAIKKCQALAKLKYRGNWEEALDEAYYHIVTHYDESKGNLLHYTARVVSTIYLKHNSHEVLSDTVLDIESDKLAIEESVNEGLNHILEWENEIEYNDEVRRCIQYLLPYFLKDYELFKSQDSSKRKMNYQGIFNMFSPKVLWGALNILVKSHYEDACYLGNLSKKCHYRCFAPDRYKASQDKTLAFVSQIGRVVTCKAIGFKRKRYVYKLDIRDLLGKLFHFFYTEGGVARRVFCSTVVYCTLSGRLVLSKEELYSYLEREIVGSILAARTNLKVLHYQVGSELLLTSTREDEPSLVLSMFGAGVVIPLIRLSLGRIL